MFNPGIFTVLKNNEPAPPVPNDVSEDLDDPIHEKWQKLCREGQIVEAVVQVRALGLDLPSAYALVNSFREREGIMPVRRRWWRLFS